MHLGIKLFLKATHYILELYDDVFTIYEVITNERTYGGCKSSLN